MKMHRQHLLQQLEDYKHSIESAHEKEIYFQFMDFVTKNPNCFKRSLLIGHLTASCWIMSEDFSSCLLTLHKKLNLWIQLGGHADGNPDLIEVAKQEGYEESGLKSLQLLDEKIFDLSIHTIPRYKETPPHLHYDVRFLFKADKNEPLKMSEESKDLKWLNLKDLESYTQEPSVLGMRDKILTSPSSYVKNSL